MVKSRTFEQGKLSTSFNIYQRWKVTWRPKKSSSLTVRSSFGQNYLIFCVSNTIFFSINLCRLNKMFRLKAKNLNSNLIFDIFVYAFFFSFQRLSERFWIRSRKRKPKIMKVMLDTRNQFDLILKNDDWGKLLYLMYLLVWLIWYIVLDWLLTHFLKMLVWHYLNIQYYILALCFALF